ncbi:hypothetical protein R6Q57_008636 [Mikania cordata]
MDPNQTPNQYYNPNTQPNRNQNTPPSNWFFSHSPINPFFDSNYYRPNFDSSPQQGFYTFADYGSSQQPHGFGQLSQDEVVSETQHPTNAGPSAQPKQRRRHKKKQVGDTEPAVGGSSRLEKWSPEEEFQLRKAWIDVSEDPIVGNWVRIPTVQYREEFSAPFTLKRSWKIMRKCPNWVRIPTVQTSASKRSKTSSTDSPGTSDARVHINLNDLDKEEEDNDDEIEDLTRPIGRDRAKTDRAKARRGSLSQTTPDYNQGIEHLSQRISDFNELKRKRQRSSELQIGSKFIVSSPRITKAVIKNRLLQKKAVNLKQRVKKGLPKKFCIAHLPKHDETVVLLNENGREFNTKFLVDKTGLSGGWRGFSIAHKLIGGDALVFHLIDEWKFKVYIIRVNGANEIDGALALLNLVPCDTNIYQQFKNGSKILQNVDNMDIDLHKENIQENSLAASDQSVDDNDYANPVSEGLRFSQSVLEFNEIKCIDDFSIVVDNLVIDSEIPKHFQIKYHDLCHSQKTYLHENLLKGLNAKLAVGIILETITIADAIRACKTDVARDDLDTWDRTLKGFEEVGMNVSFLRARIHKLVGLLFESNKLLEAKQIEQLKAEDEMIIICKKLNGLKDVIKNLDVEIETLKLKGKNLDLVFCKEANAPW